jgi:hypothetical protein
MSWKRILLYAATAPLIQSWPPTTHVEEGTMKQASYVAALSIATLGFCLPAPSKAALQGVIYPYPEGGVFLLSGWDSYVSARTSGVCVIADPYTAVRELKYGTSDEVTDQASLMDSFSVSVQGKVSSILGGSASASMSISEQTHLNSSGLNYSVFQHIDEKSVIAVGPGLGKLLEAEKNFRGSNSIDSIFGPPYVAYDLRSEEIAAINRALKKAKSPIPPVGVIHLTDYARDLARIMHEG